MVEIQLMGVMFPYIAKEIKYFLLIWGAHLAFTISLLKASARAFGYFGEMRPCCNFVLRELLKCLGVEWVPVLKTFVTPNVDIQYQNIEKPEVFFS